MSDENDTKQQDLKAHKTLRLFGLGVGALGALLIVFGIYFLFIANETLSWSSAEGSVLNAEVSTHVSLTKNPAGAARNTYVEYYVSVQYTYDVEGDSYTSSRYSLGQGERASRLYGARAEAEAEAASRFPQGAAVTVYFDPKNPTDAVLKTGWNWGTFVPVLMGLFLGGTGWLFYAVGKSAKVPSESKA
ncbi:DUF3592 domain-containing protein [Thiorhodovibrio litoralis]|uniref:DUF3592 domain-containing protein n=1 Tax=Thiorhodovibrio litoralis TaxID=2952932 RepID=UPI002B257440|nr:DUF3592 domain-containing protein [Thiorhodovibrio litoralis]WPL13115.1 hypothetical protein Thiosp_02907 [Thiorhodovibrio litoralis]